MLLTDIIAARVGMELDRESMRLDIDQAIAARERARLTRDLHDGILQSLTAANLHLKLSSDNADESTRGRLAIVKELLTSEQRRIRQFVQESYPAKSADQIILHDELTRLLREAGRHWDCAISLTVEPKEARIPATLCTHLSFLLAEAVANAVRHGGATKIEVSIEVKEQQVALKIRDDGRGFADHPLSVTKTGSALVQSAPASINGRVRELGGLLDVFSSLNGVELDIRVPL